MQQAEKNFQIGKKVFERVKGLTIETKEDLVKKVMDEFFKASEESKPGTDVSTSLLALGTLIDDGVAEVFGKLRGRKIESPEDVEEIADILFEEFKKMPMSRDSEPAKKEEYSFEDLLADSKSGRLAKDTAQMRELTEAVEKLSAESKIDIETVKKLLDIGLKVATIVSLLL